MLTIIAISVEPRQAKIQGCTYRWRHAAFCRSLVQWYNEVHDFGGFFLLVVRGWMACSDQTNQSFDATNERFFFYFATS